MDRWSDDDLAGSFTPVRDRTGLDAVFAQLGTAVLFLHDPYCPISARARAEMGRSGVSAWSVDVSRFRALTRHIAEVAGVRHESPQVIVLAGGRPAWSASHGAISASAVNRAVTRVSAALAD